jgi:DNA recombination protein RmuC
MSANLLYLVLGLLTGALAVFALWSRDRSRLTADSARLQADAARLQAERDAALRAAEVQRADAADTESQLRETFAALSRDALKDNRDEFLLNAGALLKPVQETLDRVRTQIADVDKAREGSYQAVTARLSALAEAEAQLRSTTEGLSRALQSPNARGRWGEVQLRRVIEAAGLVEHCDFIEQATVTSDSGARQTPDIVIQLPGGTSLVIDAKVPIDAYLSAIDARTDAERQAALSAHARQFRDHVRSLGAKEYWKQFQPAPDFVVMFLPLEPLLGAAFEQDGTLFESAATVRVIPATPMTLLAILMGVASSWKQEQLAANAEEIRAIGQDLYDRLATMVGHLDKVRESITATADHYNRFVGSLEQKVLPGARRFKELGLTATKELEAPDKLALAVRQVAKPELIEPSPGLESRTRFG